jgi:hypothetical protein
MEFRWLTTEENRTRTVEIETLPELLALAQKLQAEGGGLVREDEVIEMGRELGVRPEYVREALRVRRREAQPRRRVIAETELPAAEHHPLAATARALFTLFGLLLLPMVARGLYDSGAGEPWIVTALLAAAVGSWAARHPRLAGIAGATAVPMILLVASLYGNGRGLRPDTFLLSLLSLGPLCATAGRGAAAVRRWAEDHLTRQRLTASDR